MPDSRETSILAAYDTATFDERTSDERGFGARFENEFKPLLRASAAFNLGVMDRRRQRRRTAKIIAVIVGFGFVPVLALLYLTYSEAVAVFTFYGIVIAGIALFGWAFKKRPEENDPNHATVIDAVLRQFGCRVAGTSRMERRMPAGSPIHPGWSKIHVIEEHIAGRFDDRIRFVALRVRTTMKQGKSVSETFRGWYMRIDLPFSFSGTTVIHEYLAPSYRFGKRIDTRTMSQVALEDPEFARRFSAWANDQIEARMILTPDVMEHLKAEADRLEPEGQGWKPSGDLMLGFTKSHVHVWLPSSATALSDWHPLEPAKMIEDLHDAFVELAQLRAFLRDIDVISESEGFRAQAARNTRGSGEDEIHR